MITEINWTQRQEAWEYVRVGTISVINPNPKRYRLVTGNYLLAEVATDGTNEAEDIANAKTLCRLHYQHSFSGDT